MNVSGLENNAFGISGFRITGISGESVRRCRLSVQPRTGDLCKTIWQTSVTKRLGAGEGGQRLILRLPRRCPHASSRQLPVRICAARFFRKCASRSGLGARFPAVPAPADHNPVVRRSHFRKYASGLGAAAHIPSQARVRAGARPSSAYFLKPALSSRASPTRASAF